MAIYFMLMACYSSMKSSIERVPIEYKQFYGGFDWKVAGFAVSWLMLLFSIGSTIFCAPLPWVVVFFFASLLFGRSFHSNFIYSVENAVDIE